MSFKYYNIKFNSRSLKVLANKFKSNFRGFLAAVQQQVVHFALYFG